MKVYVLQTKSFYISNGYDHQVADLGFVGSIYTSKKKALNALISRHNKEKESEEMKVSTITNLEHLPTYFEAQNNKTGFRRVTMLLEEETL